MWGTFEQSDKMTPKQLLLIDVILTLSETLLKRKCQWRIMTIHTVMTYCDLKKGQPCSCDQHSCSSKSKTFSVIQAADQAHSTINIVLSQAISSIKMNKRSTICFLCLENSVLSIHERVVLFATSGSLSQHFFRKHVRKLKDWEHINCQIYDMRLKH